MMQSTVYRAFQYRKHKRELNKIKGRNSQWTTDTTEISETHFRRKQLFKSLAENQKQAAIQRDNVLLFHRLRKIQREKSNIRRDITGMEKRQTIVRKFKQRTRCASLTHGKKERNEENRKMRRNLKKVTATSQLRRDHMGEHWRKHVSRQKRIAQSAKQSRRHPQKIIGDIEKTTQLVLSDLRSQEVDPKAPSYHRRNRSRTMRGSKPKKQLTKASRTKSFLVNSGNEVMKETRTIKPKTKSNKKHKRSQSMAVTQMQIKEEDSQLLRPDLSDAQIRAAKKKDLDKHARAMTARRSVANLGIKAYLKNFD